ncbi:MAG: Gfo/Idh/MocA family oxidoreductase [Candidatus Poribacteria bacterium]|nr:Gfo/Idh/MocA family oxidoreductase [Candidatus Poribacteria bacterium]
MATYRIGVIGHTGSGNYGHGLDTVWLSIDGAEIAAVADADPGGLKAAGERLGVPQERRYADYRQMLNNERLDFVSVCPRWAGERREMVVAAAESGIRGIYCEKPFSQTPKDADAMLNACERNGVKIAVAHQNRAHPFIQTAQEMIEDGAIGEIRELHGFGKQDRRGGGLDLTVLGTHIFDLMRLFGGDPVSVSAVVLEGGRPVGQGDARQGDEQVGLIAGDHLRATYLFENGIVGTFRSRREGSHFGNRSMGVQIEGSEGVLDYRCDRLCLYPHGCLSPPPSADEWVVVGHPSRSKGVVELNKPLVLDLIQAVEEDREPMCSGRNARWSMEMILGVYAAHRHGRAALPLTDRRHPLEGWEAP